MKLDNGKGDGSLFQNFKLKIQTKTKIICKRGIITKKNVNTNENIVTSSVRSTFELQQNIFESKEGRLKWKNKSKK